MPIVNGHEAEPGCYVDGHWGQYGPDHLADVAEGFGWDESDETSDPRLIRAKIESLEPSGAGDLPEREASLWDVFADAADDIERWLNEHTEAECICGKPESYHRNKPFHPAPVQYVWHWHDGEFFLSPICDDPETCTDDTCAHWD